MASLIAAVGSEAPAHRQHQGCRGAELAGAAPTAFLQGFAWTPSRWLPRRDASSVAIGIRSLETSFCLLGRNICVRSGVLLAGWKINNTAP